MKTSERAKFEMKDHKNECPCSWCLISRGYMQQQEIIHEVHSGLKAIADNPMYLCLIPYVNLLAGVLEGDDENNSA